MLYEVITPIFDIVVLACGVYLIWAAITMKRNRTIPGIMLSKGAEISKTADTEGFLNYMFYPTLMMGIIGSISGLLGVAIVITSYSIHYTKLYEHCGQWIQPIGRRWHR